MICCVEGIKIFPCDSADSGLCAFLLFSDTGRRAHFASNIKACDSCYRARASLLVATGDIQEHFSYDCKIVYFCHFDNDVSCFSFRSLRASRWTSLLGVQLVELLALFAFVRFIRKGSN